MGCVNKIQAKIFKLIFQWQENLKVFSKPESIIEAVCMSSVIRDLSKREIALKDGKKPLRETTRAKLFTG